LQAFRSKDGRRWHSHNVSAHDASAVSFAQRCVLEDRERKLIDFDDHLDDISLNWFNPSDTLFSTLAASKSE
jgi:hypothetical protein